MIHPVISFNGPLWIIFYSYGSYFFRKLQQSFKRKFDGTSTTTTTTATIKKKYFYSYLLIFMKETQRKGNYELQMWMVPSFEKFILCNINDFFRF